MHGSSREPFAVGLKPYGPGRKRALAVAPQVRLPYNPHLKVTVAPRAGATPKTEFRSMAEFTQFGTAPRVKPAKRTSNGTLYVDYKNVEDLRRTLTPNGKIQSRKRTGLNSQEQRLLSQAIKRARFMALLPYTSATL
jgi:small subunit ribosomal protein S18